MRHLNVLIACEESQSECFAFRALGHNAFSCDLQVHRRGGRPEWHIHGDVSRYLHGCTQFYTSDGRHHHLSRWHLIIAHPPCTYLCKVSSQHLYKNPDIMIEWRGKRIMVNGNRYNSMLAGRAFFYECLSADAPYVAVENPLPMAMAELPQSSCFVQPFWFGENYSKKTLYWTKNLPPLMPDNEVANPKQYVRSSRGKYRSRTFKGIANAIARQWGDYVCEQLNINVRK